MNGPLIAGENAQPERQSRRFFQDVGQPALTAQTLPTALFQWLDVREVLRQARRAFLGEKITQAARARKRNR